MAVPKKRMSKSRTNARKAVWKRQAKKASQKALSLAKSILKNKETSFLYKDEDDTNKKTNQSETNLSETNSSETNSSETNLSE